MAVMILGRNRVLELYLNVIEWGPGVYRSRGRGGVSLSHLGGGAQSGTIGTASRDPAFSATAQAGTDESVQRDHSRSNAALAGELVIMIC